MTRPARSKPPLLVEQLQLLSDALPALISYVDRELRYQFCNQAYSEWFGLSRSDVMGKSMLEVLGAAAMDRILPHLERAFDGHAADFESQLASKHGGTRWVRVMYTPHRNSESQIMGVFILVTDISEQKRWESALQRERERLSMALAAGSMGAYELDFSNDSLWWSSEVYAVFGLDPKSFTPTHASFSALVHPDDRDEFWRHLEQTMVAHESFMHEFRIVRPDGTVRWIHHRAKTEYDTNGVPVRQFGIGIDVTERRRTDAALRASEGQLRLFIEHAPAAIAMFDREMRYLALSRRWKDDYQLQGELVGRSHYEVFPEIGERWKEVHRRGLLGEIFTADEDPFVRANGSTQWIKWEVRPWCSHDGDVAGILVATEDVTARVLAKQAFHESEAVLRTVTNEAQVGLVMVDKNRKYLFANRTYAEILGLPDEHIVGKRVADVLPDLYDQIAPRLDRAFAGERVMYELRFPNHPMGGERFYEVVYQPRTQHTLDPYVVVVIVNITERKRSEKRLDEQRRVLKSVTDNATVALFITDEQQHCTFMNPAAEHLTGFKLGELRGRRLHDMIHHTRPDGTRYFLEECPIDRAFPQNNQEHGKEIFIHKDGHFYDVAFTASPIRDASGQPIGTVIEVRDITDEKRAAEELRRSEARHRQLAEALREADRRKDEYLAMLAHELRNPLAPMLNAAHLVQQLGHGIPKVAWASEIIQRQATHMARLIDDLLDVSRIACGKIILRKEPVVLSTLVKTVAEDHRSPIEAAGLHFHVSVTNELSCVIGDKTRLAQVISNLLQNATKFTPTGGHIHLELLREQNYAVVRVEDTGIGMSPDLLSKIFEPFVQATSSLDRSKGGLGLGLSLAKGIVNLHGGTITAHSAGQGSGSTFEMKIPLREDREE